MKATLMLADHAEVADGKLFINGGGWNVIGPAITPYGIAMYVEVPWDQTNAKHTLLLELLDADGEPVTVATPDGNEEPIQVETQLEVGRPVGVNPGTPLGVPFAVNFAPAPPVAPGGQYVWTLTIDGHADEDWRLTFSTRPNGPQSMAA